MSTVLKSYKAHKHATELLFRLVLMIAFVSSCNGFTALSTTTARKHFQGRRYEASSNLQQPSDKYIPSAPSTVCHLIPFTTDGLPVATDVEAEVLTGLAHVTLDFTGFLPSSGASRILMRLSAVLGRIFVISADYLPDHSVHPEELAIQLLLLSIAMQDIVKHFLRCGNLSDKQFPTRG